MSRVAWIIDHSLQGQTGHHYEVSTAAQEGLEKLGYKVVIYAHQVFAEKAPEVELLQARIKPFFRESWTEKNRLNFLVEAICSLLHCAPPLWILRRGFAKDLRILIATQDAVKPDLILIHTLSFAQILSVGVELKMVACPIKLVLRYDPRGPGLRGKIKFWTLKFIFRLIRDVPIQFFTDTEGLTETYRELFHIHVKTLPIVHHFKQVHSYLKPRPNAVYLGDAREEKGFHLLPAFIEIAHKLNPDIVFTIQIHMTGSHNSNLNIQNTALQLENMRLQKPNHIILLQGELAEESYLAILAEASHVLLLYDVKSYQLRSSGILAQALSHGTQAVAPYGTSLAEIIKQYEGGLLYTQLTEAAQILAESTLATLWPYQASVDTEWTSQSSPFNFARALTDP